MLTQSPMFQQSVGVYGGGTQLFSYVQLFATPWTVACQAPLSTGFSRQEYRRRLPLNLCFLCLLNWQADFLPLCQLANLFACICVYIYIYESESHSVVSLTFCDPMDWYSPGQNTEMGRHSLLLDAWGWCTGTTQREGMGREEVGGFRMGSTGIPVADSF